ncbi:hypothetical protein PG996_012919 [Apiospora saccharicola]|uniref:Uncharacterized protein n=1 Tax=Apiospora saccharicola TaxID=335842 RepID=A0ABR1U447_9PEZI
MPSFTPFRTAAHSALRLTSRSSPRTAPTAMSMRPLSTSAARMAYKDDQDRTSVKPRAHEYSGSGTDEQMSDNPDAAFNPDTTSPEEAMKKAGQGSKKHDDADGTGESGNPLGVSPANQEVSKGGQGAMEDKPQQGNQAKKSVSSTGGGGGTATKGGGSRQK